MNTSNPVRRIANRSFVSNRKVCTVYVEKDIVAHPSCGSIAALGRTTRTYVVIADSPVEYEIAASYLAESAVHAIQAQA